MANAGDTPTPSLYKAQPLAFPKIVCQPGDGYPHAVTVHSKEHLESLDDGPWFDSEAEAAAYVAPTPKTKKKPSDE